MSTVLYRCNPKKRYTSKDEARDAAKRQSHQLHRHIGTYRCDWCGGWHTGNPRGGRRRDRR